MYKVIKVPKGKKEVIDCIVDISTGEVVTPKYANLTKADYENKGVYSIEPMTAKEYLNDEELEKMLNSDEYIAEEKLDGTRSTLHLYDYGNRLFSRRISVKTDWYAENSDSVPHLRDLEVPEEYHKTVLDGEMRIDGLGFKDVSSTLNCTWDEAIARQQEIGFITFHAFDIIYYKGVNVTKMPLIQRKDLLAKVVNALNNPYVKEEPYFDDVTIITIDDKMVRDFVYGEIKEGAYPNLYLALKNNIDLDIETFEKNDGYGADFTLDIEIDKTTFYEYIVYKGGEGIMLKAKNGKYRHKRGREYTKLKKFSTWDVVILDFIEPTREYTGKELEKWLYWYHSETNTRVPIEEVYSKTILHCEPVTKHFYYNWIGTIKYGVVITDEELAKWKKTNPKETPEIIKILPKNGCNFINYLVVGECSGFDEETREHITCNKDKFRQTVIEVGANEIMKTGKLRHPRFIRFREDKNSEQCTWKDHIRA